jgi:2,3-bisphosphoglycerate-dependent phosphoglycerate mutase|tara:strand:- start:2245 stop:2958 length:714 start_codon:yes stop_codon:yes gene_type:complete
MSFLILVRHGQSTWNLEKRFTGWVDVDLTAKGELEAEKAGLLIKEKSIHIDFYYSSLQLRANNTLKIIQKVLNDKKIFSRAWQLNERHYGALTGLNKVEMIKKIGEKKVHEFRRSWNIKPAVLNKESPYHPTNIETYDNMSKEVIPDTESLKDTYERVVKYFEKEIKNKLKNKNVLISAHGNSIRALCKKLFDLDNSQISSLEIPTGNPLIIELDTNLKIIKCEYLDNERAKDLVAF